MPGPVKTCANCLHSYRAALSAKYLRCDLSEAPQTNDASLAAEMRKGACGPTATLWEQGNGED